VRALRKHCDVLALCLLLFCAFAGASFYALGFNLLAIAPVSLPKKFSNLYTLAIAQPSNRVVLASPGNRLPENFVAQAQAQLGKDGLVFASSSWSTATNANEPARTLSVIIGDVSALPLIAGRAFSADELACVARRGADKTALNLGTAHAVVVGELPTNFIGIDLRADVDYFCSLAVSHVLGTAGGRSIDMLRRNPNYGAYVATDLPLQALQARLGEIRFPPAAGERRFHIERGWISSIESKERLAAQMQLARVLITSYVFFALAALSLIHVSQLQRERAQLEIKRALGARVADLLWMSSKPLLGSLLLSLVIFSTAFYGFRSLVQALAVDSGLLIVQSFNSVSALIGVVAMLLCAGTLWLLKWVLLLRVVHQLSFRKAQHLTLHPKLMLLGAFLSLNCAAVALAIVQMQSVRLPAQADFGVRAQALAFAYARGGEQLEFPFE
jgi:hypothetical protein